MKTVGDLLAHYPRRYARRGELTPISSLPVGEPVTIVAEVLRANERRMQNRKGSILEVVISDGAGSLSLTFFNQSWRMKDLRPGRRGIFAGKVGEYKGSKHVQPTQRVAYDQSPPFGGPHDGAWADCTGVVYDKAVRTENMVHGLEHGAVWIAYNPDQVKDDALAKLKAKVEGVPYMMMSPYPGLDKPISLQSWGHQLKVEKADDERVDQFISSLLRNANTYPEVGASCENSQFLSNPAPFVAEKPGADAVPMDGGTDESKTESQQGQVPASTPPSGSASTPPSS